MAGSDLTAERIVWEGQQCINVGAFVEHCQQSCSCAMCREVVVHPEQIRSTNTQGSLGHVASCVHLHWDASRCGGMNRDVDVSVRGAEGLEPHWGGPSTFRCNQVLCCHCCTMHTDKFAQWGKLHSVVGKMHQHELDEQGYVACAIQVHAYWCACLSAYEAITIRLETCLQCGA